ncbi:hypothetical protein JOE51_007607 [Bradyrhizobium japonicum]|nr:hypothetical protein [Bradyrhizobium japonicum]
MWSLIVVFLTANNGFTVPGFSSEEKCRRAEFEIFNRELPIAASKQKTGLPPPIFTYCLRVD